MKQIMILLLLVSCAHRPQQASQDNYLWLEDIEGAEALKWVEAQNEKSQKALTQNSRYQKAEKDTLAILEAKDKIPTGYFEGSNIVNFWRDDVAVRGLLRKTPYTEYKKANPKWKTILDIDALAKKENENWVFKGMDCLEPEYQYCMVSLSRGGKDATVSREFDGKKMKFVDKGFTLPEAKTGLTWADKDHLLVSTDFGEGTLTESGYPRQIRLWKRGTPIASAKTLMNIEVKDVRATSWRMEHRQKAILILSHAIDFFNTEESVFDLKTGKVFKISKPPQSELVGYYDGYLLYKLRKPWSFAGTEYMPGAVISLAQSSVGKELTATDVALLFSPKANQSVQSVTELKDKIVIATLEDVKSQLYYTEKKGGKEALWAASKALILVDGTGQVQTVSSTDEKDLFLFSYENFNQPNTLYEYEFLDKVKKLKASPDRFDAKDLVVSQKFATSKDGTKIPYFLVHKKGLVLDGTAPTLQYGYGGFNSSQTPQYNSLVGKLWMERGGVYVVANIRGGGEYGPSWHQAVLKENRQKAYDDFIAVSEDLIKNKVTSPSRLAIRGGSNGGLLVGAVMAQRPDLYGAVLCWVPLLDMVRYNKLLAGASWMSEYGNPDVPKELEPILKYSPYQNVHEDRKYPPILLVTSTKDDRVHPGHARKMAAKMIDQKHFVMYYENTEGGHGAGANLKQLAKLNALQFEFLLQTIGTSL